MKVFISYTLKDNELTKEKLANVKSFFMEKGINTYIDCLEKTTTQNKVEMELKTSSILILLLTHCVYQSQWVNRELFIAKENNIPIIKRKISEVFDSTFIESLSSTSLMEY